MKTILPYITNNFPRTRTIAAALDKKNENVNTHKRINKLIYTNITKTTTMFIANYIKGRKTYTTFRNTTPTQHQLKTFYNNMQRVKANT